MAELTPVEGTNAWRITAPGQYELPMRGPAGGAWPTWNRLWTTDGFAGATVTLEECPGQSAPQVDVWFSLAELVSGVPVSFESKATRYRLNVVGGTPDFFLWVA